MKCYVRHIPEIGAQIQVRVRCPEAHCSDLVDVGAGDRLSLARCLQCDKPCASHEGCPCYRINRRLMRHIVVGSNGLEPKD